MVIGFSVVVSTKVVATLRFLKSQRDPWGFMIQFGGLKPPPRFVKEDEFLSWNFAAEVACLFFMSGMLLLNSILMMIKFLRRHVLSDVFFTFFFVFGSLGYGLHAIASQTLAAGDNWSVAWSVGRKHTRSPEREASCHAILGNSWRTWRILG